MENANEVVRLAWDAIICESRLLAATEHKDIYWPSPWLTPIRLGERY